MSKRNGSKGRVAIYICRVNLDWMTHWPGWTSSKSHLAQKKEDRCTDSWDEEKWDPLRCMDFMKVICQTLNSKENEIPTIETTEIVEWLPFVNHSTNSNLWRRLTNCQRFKQTGIDNRQRFTKTSSALSLCSRQPPLLGIISLLSCQAVSLGLDESLRGILFAKLLEQVHGETVTGALLTILTSYH